MHKMIGEKFGRLTVQSHVGHTNGDRTFSCLCDCGATTVTRGYSLRSGGTKSCGCLQREATKNSAASHITHGLSKTPTYSIWKGMIERCMSETSTSYSRYGAVGVTVSEEWLSFVNFYSDMGPRPEGLTLDRIDGSKGYCKDNCRWVTPKEQAMNRGTTTKIEYAGVVDSVAGWAKRLGISATSMHKRLKKWPLEKAVTKPIGMP